MIRIVRMDFQPENVGKFLEMFQEVSPAIRNFPGCNALWLHRDEVSDTIYYTYSVWENASDLAHYRESELFQATWKQTKSWFRGKPQAFSLQDGKEVQR